MGVNMFDQGETWQAIPVPEHRLVRQIGKGGCGVVWLALSSLGSWRAVKLVGSQGDSGPKAHERELLGLRIYEPISHQHPGLLPILSAGCDPASGVLWSVMELADAVGEPGTKTFNPESYQPDTLEERLRQAGGRLPPPEVLRILMPIAGGLAHLHACGVVHRDVKPGNILFVRGSARLADCGLVSTPAAAKTYVGTPGYIAPEGPGSPGADVFALGMVLYRVTFGRHPADWPSLPTGLGESGDPWLETQLNEVMLRAMAPDPAQRYPDGASLLADLERVAAGQPLLPRSRRIQFHRRSLLLAVAVTVAAVATVAGTLVLGGRWGHRRPVTPEPRDSGRVQLRQHLPGGSNAPLVTRTDRLASPGPWIDITPLPIATPDGPMIQLAAVERNTLHFLDEDGVPLESWSPHVDARNLRIHSAGDLDRDGTPEAMVSWSSGTNVHLAVVTPRPMVQLALEESAVTVAGNKGMQHIQTTFKPVATDVNPQTGYPLLLAQLDDGRVRTPGRSRRQLIAYELAPAGTREAWRLDLPAGCDENLRVVPPNPAGIRYLLATYAPDNEHQAPDGSDDSHSWLYALDRTGRVRWRRVLGDWFTRSEVCALRWPDGSLEIATLTSAPADYRRKVPTLPAKAWEVGRLVTFDLHGNELRRFEHDCQIVAWCPPRSATAATDGSAGSSRAVGMHAAIDSRGRRLLLDRSLTKREMTSLLPIGTERLAVRFIGTGPVLDPEQAASVWMLWRERPVVLPKLGSSGHQATVIERGPQEILIWDANLNPRVHLRVVGPDRTRAHPDELRILPAKAPGTPADLLLTGRDTITRIPVPAVH